MARGGTQGEGGDAYRIALPFECRETIALTFDDSYHNQEQLYSLYLRVSKGIPDVSNCEHPRSLGTRGIAVKPGSSRIYADSSRAEIVDVHIGYCQDALALLEDIAVQLFLIVVRVIECECDSLSTLKWQWRYDIASPLRPAVPASCPLLYAPFIG